MPRERNPRSLQDTPEQSKHNVAFKFALPFAIVPNSHAMNRDDVGEQRCDEMCLSEPNYHFQNQYSVYNERQRRTSLICDADAAKLVS